MQWSNPSWRRELAAWMHPRRRGDGLTVGRAQEADRVRTLYSGLIDEMRSDGYRVENYQFPIMADKWRAESTLLQRLLNLADITTGREVWMLYTSFMRTVGPGMVWTCGHEARAIAVGTTGGGRISQAIPRCRF